MSFRGHSGRRAVAGAVNGNAWSRSRKGLNIQLSNFDLTAKKINTNAVWSGVEGVKGLSAGTPYFDTTVDNYGATKQTRIGIIATGSNLNTQAFPAGNIYFYYSQSNVIYGPGGVILESGLATTANGDIISPYIDFGALTVRWKKNGTFFTAAHSINADTYFPYNAFRNIGEQFTTDFTGWV
jgi:hypothetical protein